METHETIDKTRATHTVQHTMILGLLCARRVAMDPTLEVQVVHLCGNLVGCAWRIRTLIAAPNIKTWHSLSPSVSEGADCDAEEGKERWREGGDKPN